MDSPLHELIVEGPEDDAPLLLSELRHGERAWAEATVEQSATV